MAPTRQNELPAVRRELQKDLRAFIKKVGSELGEIYTKPDLKWGDLFRMQKVCALQLTARYKWVGLAEYRAINKIVDTRTGCVRVSKQVQQADTLLTGMQSTITARG